MTRTFIALLDEAQQRHLGELIRQMARELPTLRWVDVAGIHLTLSRPKAPLKQEEQAILQRFLEGKRSTIAAPLYHARQLSVMKSELTRVGAKYTCLRNYALLG